MAEPKPPLLDRIKSIGGAEELVSGTFITTIAAPFAANVYNIKANAGDFFAEGEREPDGNYVGSLPAIAGKTPGTIEFDMDVAPAGPFLSLLTLCGYKSTAGTYAPSSDLSLRKTWSFKVWENGRVKKFAGCTGNVTFDVEAGKRLVAHFTISGVWQGTADEAMPAQAPIAALPYVAKGITLTMAGAAIAHTNKVSVDLGAAYEERESLTSAGAIAHFLVGEIEPKLTMDPEARLVADADQYGLFLAGTTAAVVVALTNGANTLTITAGAAQRTKVNDDTRGKRKVDTLNLGCRITNGDDALTLAEA